MKKICAFILSVLMFFAVNLPILAQSVDENNTKEIIEYSIKKIEAPKKKYFDRYNYYFVTIKNNGQNTLEITNIKYPEKFKDNIQKVANGRKLKGQNIQLNLVTSSQMFLFSPVMVILGALAVVPTTLLAIIALPSTKDKSTRNFLLSLPAMSLCGIFSPVWIPGSMVYELSHDLHNSISVKKAYKNLNKNYYVSEYKQKIIIPSEKSIDIILLGGLNIQGHTDIGIELQDTKTQETYTKMVILEPNKF